MSSDNDNHLDGTSDHSILDEVIAEYIRACEAGQPPDRDDLLAAHADLADELREFFANRDQMDQVARPMRDLVTRVLNVRCPHCHNPIELLDEAPLRDINCPSCGSSFSLVGNKSQGHYPNGSKTIGHFELLDRVGIGAFGSVWKARDTKLDRTVAVKIPRYGQLDESETEMFLRDARAAAQLKHPNIVGVHEVGKQNGTIYIVSDFIQGATLKEWMAGETLTPREAAEQCVKIAKALHHAHEAGVIHRDLKPGNIMMDADDEPHIVDFGLAKREAGEITMTVEGQILGTPAYMSPEQARGEGHKVDRRADIYSLGVILFELLTGELPFRGEKQMLIVQILNEDPPVPRKLNSGVPRDLETICLKCLEKDRHKRYSTGLELAEDVDRWLTGNAILARPVGLTRRGVKWIKRRPAAAGLLVVSLIAVAAVSVASVAGWYNDRLKSALTYANQQRAKAETLFKEVDAARQSEEGLLEEAVQARRAEQEARELADNYLYLYRIALAEREFAAKDMNAAKDILSECPAKFRGWEWHYLNAKFNKRETSTTRMAHNDHGVCQVAFSPDGALLASAGWDGKVHLWDCAKWEIIATFSGPNRSFFGVAFSPDGRLLAAAGGTRQSSTNPGYVLIWDVATHELTQTLAGHGGAVYSVAFHPDGVRLASAGAEGTIRVWSTDTGEQIQEFGTYYARNGIHAVFSPDGKYLAAGVRKAGKLLTWDVSDWQQHLSIAVDGPSSHSAFRIAYSPSGEQLIFGRGQLSKSQTNIVAMDAQSGALVQELNWRGRRGLSHMFRLYEFAFTPDGRRLVTASADGTVKLWDMATRRAVLTLEHESGVISVAVSPDGRRIAAATGDPIGKSTSQIVIWDAGIEQDRFADPDIE